jgi:hypothetical protein
VTRALDRDGELSLMSSAYAGHAAGKDLGALGDESAKSHNVLVVNMLYLINTESAYLLALTATTLWSI